MAQPDHYGESRPGGWDSSDLSEISRQIWDRLSAAAAEGRDPVRLPVLCVASESGATGRVVVLRKVDIAGRRLTAYTDARSHKVEMIHRSPKVEWIFYDPNLHIQIRARGEATFLEDERAVLAAWESTPKTNRLNYRSPQGPGSRIENADQYLSDEQPPLPSQDQKAIEAGRENFAIIECAVERMDWLQLGQPFHRRATFVWDGRQFTGNWVVP